jgi:hypothetical protein
LYQSGSGCRASSLQKGHAIFYGKHRKTDLYALLEWEGPEPIIRSSSEDKTMGRALAVAGLYESEELIADDASPLPLESPEERASRSRGGKVCAPSPRAEFLRKGGRPRRDISRPTAKTALRGVARRGGVQKTPAEQAAAVAQSRTILVRFVPLEKGLAFDAFWQGLDGSVAPALKLYASTPTHVNETERERIIRLTALARKTGFELEGETHDIYFGRF